jgi:hypothetical protein
VGSGMGAASRATVPAATRCTTGRKR